jgi:hypothetical protein
MIDQVALRRLGLLLAAEAPAHPQKKLMFLAELARLGFAVDNPEAYNDSLLRNWPTTLSVLRCWRGGAPDYVPLFQGFPQSVPDEREYFVQRMLGFLVNRCLDYPAGHRLANGVVVPNWLFELEQFGADPISQFQDPDLFEAGRQRQLLRSGDEHTEWIGLKIVSPGEMDRQLLNYLRSNLYARSSIPEAARADLELLMEHFGPHVIEPERVVFRETRTYLLKACWNRGQWQTVQRLIGTATDWLRLFAALTGSEVSLAEKIRYPRLSRAQRRLVLERLEQLPGLEEDLRRYRGLWMALRRGLHPGQWGQRYPRVVQAFQALGEHRLRSFNSDIEIAFARGESLQVLARLAERPGLLARRLRALLLQNPQHQSQILQQVATIAEDVPLKIWLVLRGYFRQLPQAQYRTVINKKGGIYVAPLGQRPDSQCCDQLEQFFDGLIRQQLSGRPSWRGKKVWIDSRLRNYVVPLALRKASEGVQVWGRGTRVPLGTGRVLRLFVYWKQHQRRTDLDLSLIRFSSGMQYTGHVSYTRLQSEGIVHSGDLQSAPEGAAEFIDAELEVLKKDRRCRYLAPVVYRYCGDSFAQMDCQAGWMMRDQVDCNYQSFDVKTVQQKFDLSGQASYCCPVLVDLWEQQVHFVDLYVRGLEDRNRVEESVTNISTLAREMVRLGSWLPNYEELARLHLEARGATAVEHPEQADLTFGISGTDYAADRPAKILAELL